MNVTVHPQFHGSWGLYEFIKKKFTTVRCGGCSTGKSSVWATGLIADGKFGYFTVGLDLLLISFICVKRK
jgi:hypothetical protein